MSFNLESGKSKEINETPEVKVDNEQLSETEETAENFDDCSLNEVQDSKGNGVNAESLEDAEEEYDDCEAKVEKIEEKNPELAENDDFSDCGKEADGQYVADVTYTTDGEINQEEASAELQEAYNECDNPENMQQLKENVNENEHIEVHNEEVVEQSENNEMGEEITEEYGEAQKELDEAQEHLEAQQEAAQEYQEDSENQINKHEDKVIEKTENINSKTSEDIDSDAKDDISGNTKEVGVSNNVEKTIEDNENSDKVEEKIDTELNDEAKKQIVEEVFDEIDLEEECDKITTFETEEIVEKQEAVDAVEETAEKLEDEKAEQLSKQSLQERIDDVLEKEDVTSFEINSLRDEHFAELQAKIATKSDTEAVLKDKFDEVLSKEKGSDEYKQSLQEYNVLQGKKAMLDEQIDIMENQQNLLNKKSFELRDTQIQNGAEAMIASNATLSAVNLLQERYDQTYYDTKADKAELVSVREDSHSVIKELSVEKDFIKQAMDAKMDEISEYVISNNMNRYDTVNDLHYQQMSAEYNAMKESYDKIGYSIVKLDENNKAITEQLGDKYTSMLDMQSVVLLNDNFPDSVNIEYNYSLESKEFVSIMNELKEANVDYLSIELANKKRTSNEIIERLSGGDLTEGSCSSLAFAYVGNKAGYDVLDFRDGESRVFFSSRNSIRKIANLPNINSEIICGKNDIQCVNKLFETMKAGKEYYLATGQHASIVRRNNDTFEYLELQHPSTDNGWHNLDNNILLSRFCCSTTHSLEFSNFLIDVESLSNNQEFLHILGYINTSELKQRKGELGNVR